jgi:hypothetical protein
MSEINCIKGAARNGRKASGPGYILCGTASPADGQVSFAFSVENSISFVFGFSGVGCHYLCEISSREQIVALYEFRDGIPVYLHHVRVAVPSSTPFTICWDGLSIRIQMSGFNLLHVLADGPSEGQWGFRIPHGTWMLPDVYPTHAPLSPFDWICLGDGFSNNRWRNRHFLSWPELVFDHSTSYLNACVGAGNSTRVARIVERIAGRFASAQVILAAGSDDLMEGSSFEEFSGRMKNIVTSIRRKTDRKITLATLPPRVSARKASAEWSEGIKNLAGHLGSGVFDFHDWLSENFDAYMAQGEYPGALAQKALAERIAHELALPLPSAPVTPTVSHNPQVVRIAGKIARTLDPWTQDFPGLIR